MSEPLDFDAGENLDEMELEIPEENVLEVVVRCVKLPDGRTVTQVGGGPNMYAAMDILIQGQQALLQKIAQRGMAVKEENKPKILIPKLGIYDIG